MRGLEVSAGEIGRRNRSAVMWCYRHGDADTHLLPYADGNSEPYVAANPDRHRHARTWMLPKPFTVFCQAPVTQAYVVLSAACLLPRGHLQRGRGLCACHPLDHGRQG